VEISTLWIVLIITLVVDAVIIILRASLVNVRLPQLVNLGGQDPNSNITPVLYMVEKIGFRLGLRLLVNAAHFIIAGVTVFLLAAYLPQTLSGWPLLGILVVIVLALVIMEVALEGWIRPNAEAWLLRLAPLARVVEILLRPFSVLLGAVLGQTPTPERLPGAMTEDELKTWVEVGQPAGSLEKGERQMIYSIFHFGDTLCREVMVPRIDILALEVNTTVPEAVHALTLSGHSRVPVYEETIDNVIGLLYAKDLLRASLDNEEPENIRPFLRPAYFVPEAKKVDELLREMQAHSIHIAIIVDEYGGMAGLVTLEDIVEEIVGEIRDEYDQGEELLYQKISDDEFLFHGRIDLDDFNEVLGTNLVTDLADSLGGFLYGTIGRVPVGGEQVRVENWELQIEQVSGRRIRKIRAQRLPFVKEKGQTADESSNG
jgi:putative hemolysin